MSFRPIVALALRLGRVSNLPTIWTNVLVGVVLSGATPTARAVVPLGIAMSLCYVAGMFLNDAFDADWDARHRPERPIPSGLVRARTVFFGGFAFLASGLAILWLCADGARALAAGVVLAALIVGYDALHKRIRPLVAAALMAGCRVAVYATSALAVAPRLTTAVYAGAAVLLIYLLALSLIARHETRDPRLPRLVGAMIAGICLVDGGLLLLAGHLGLAGLAVAAFLLTRRLQRRIAGT